MAKPVRLSSHITWATSKCAGGCGVLAQAYFLHNLLAPTFFLPSSFRATNGNCPNPPSFCPLPSELSFFYLPPELSFAVSPNTSSSGLLFPPSHGYRLPSHDSLQVTVNLFGELPFLIAAA